MGRREEKRRRVAALAMNGILANEKFFNDLAESCDSAEQLMNTVVNTSVDYADALQEKLNEKKDPN
jgi:hypothetical protein